MLNSVEVTPQVPEGTDRDATECPVCPHPWRDHGAIDARFCRATVEHGLSRGCVCLPPR